MTKESPTMIAPLLLLDVPNLCWRAFYAMGALKHDGESTGALYGFFRDLDFLAAQLRSNRFVFCFDVGKSRRTKLYPDYKANRSCHRFISDTYTAEQALKDEVRNQIYSLHETVLPSLGFANVFGKAGYEADDIIASLCQTLPKGQEAILVSSDKDLYQLLTPCVSAYSPGATTLKHITLDHFRSSYGVEPKDWVNVKAMAGCPSDNVKGIPGVGEKSALRYLRGELPKTSTFHKRITQGRRIWVDNCKLVRLPYSGCPEFTLGEDTPDLEAWRRVCDQFGFASLRATFPGRRGRIQHLF